MFLKHEKKDKINAAHSIAAILAIECAVFLFLYIAITTGRKTLLLSAFQLFTIDFLEIILALTILINGMVSIADETITYPIAIFNS